MPEKSWDGSLKNSCKFFATKEKKKTEPQYLVTSAIP